MQMAPAPPLSLRVCQAYPAQLRIPPHAQGCIRREGASEAAPAAGRRLEEGTKAVGGGYCRLRMPLRLAVGVRETVAGHRLGALERGGGTSPSSNASLPTICSHLHIHVCPFIKPLIRLANEVYPTCNPTWHT